MMPFRKEIEQSLEQIRTLEECFRHARNSELLPISFFSTSYDIVKELAEMLHYVEQGQLKFMQEQYIANKISFLETTDLISKAKPTEISHEKNKYVKEIFEEIPVNRQEELIVDKTTFSSEKTDEILDKLPLVSKEEQLKNSFFPESLPENHKEENVVKNEKVLADTRKYMSLNDKFRFQREIFMGSAEEMNKVFDTLNGFSTIEETWSFVNNQSWNNDSEIIAEFKEFIEKRFS